MTDSRMRVILGATASIVLTSRLLVAPAAMAAPSSNSHRSPIAEEVLAAKGTKAPAMTRDLETTARKGNPADVAKAHISAHAAVYNIDPAELKTVATTDAADGKGQAVRFQQVHDGIPVYGAQYVAQTEGTASARTVDSVTGHVFTELSLNTKPGITEAAARDRLWTDKTVAHMDDPTITDLGLTILPIGEGALAWQFEVTGVDEAGDPVRQTVMIDASVGGVLLSFNKIQGAEGAAGTGVTFDGDEVPLSVSPTDDGRFELRDRSRSMYGDTGGEIVTLDANGADYSDYSGALPEGTPVFSSDTARFDGAATSLGAVDAHVNAGIVYEYFLEQFDREGVDGKGGTMLSVVNVTNGGKEYANAFWDGAKMVYGSDKGVPFSKALDVVGHEMSHAITEHSANLLYINQSGALNEGISDYFGNAMEVKTSGMSMSDPDAGLLGENLCATGTSPRDCAIRDLNDGRVAGDDYEMLSVDWDNGGVHYNSTIASGALWDIRENLDPAVADMLVYTALTDYLVPLSNFTDMRVAVELAAKRAKLPQGDRDAIAKAFDDHGIYEDWESTSNVEDADLLLADGISAYEGYAGHDDIGAVSSGDRWVTSELDIEGYFGGAPEFGLIVGEFGKSKSRTIHTEGAWDVQPAISGDRLLWTRVDGASMQVVEQVDNGVGESRVVSTNAGESFQPAVDGSTAAWLTRVGEETDVWVSRDGAAPVNLTPEEGTEAYQVEVDGDVVAWLSGRNLVRFDLATNESKTVRATAGLLGEVDALELTEDGIFWRSSSFFGDAVYFISHDMVKARKLSLGSLYGAQYTVNDDYFVYNTTSVFGALVGPSGESEAHKLRIAGIDDVLAGTAQFQRVSCSVGSQISPSLGDGSRLVYLSTSQARTDLVTRAEPVGTC